MMWVYQQTESELWTVGYYAPSGQWYSESDHGVQEDAARRVHWLNGGRFNGEDEPIREEDSNSDDDE